MPPRVERPLMAAYGVGPDLAGSLPWSWAQERLLSCRNYWVATVSPAGTPHAMPVWGIWRPADETFWFSCAPSSLKARNLAGNASIVFTTGDTTEVVSVEGSATLHSESRTVAAEYAAKYERDLSKRADLVEFLLANSMFRVKPIKALGIIEREEEFARSATRWVW